MKRLGGLLIISGCLLAAPAGPMSISACRDVLPPMGTDYAAGPGGILSAGWAWNPRFALELGLGYWPVPVAASSDGLSPGTLSGFRSSLLYGPAGRSVRASFSGEAGLGNAFTAFTLDAETVAAWKPSVLRSTNW